VRRQRVQASRDRRGGGGSRQAGRSRLAAAAYRNEKRAPVPPRPKKTKTHRLKNSPPPPHASAMHNAQRATPERATSDILYPYILPGRWPRGPEGPAGRPSATTNSALALALASWVLATQQASISALDGVLHFALPGIGSNAISIRFKFQCSMTGGGSSWQHAQLRQAAVCS
jgi:hypothetical protein